MDPGGRLVPIVDDLVRALHRAVAEHQVTEPEWRQALRFLNRPGQLHARGLDRPFSTGAFDVVLRPARR